MLEPILFARGDDAVAVEALAARLRDWEPRLDLSLDHDNQMIYEPDGILYAVSLGDGATLRARHRDYPLHAGDAIVVPRGVAIEAEPGADLVAIRHEGSPPHHFRERFIQNWGFEFRPAPGFLDPDKVTEILPEADARYRIAYRLAAIVPSRSFRAITRSDFHLLIAFGGEGSLQSEGESNSIALRSGDLALLTPGLSYEVEGTLTLGQLQLPVEAAYEALRSREMERPIAHWSPEFRQTS